MKRKILLFLIGLFLMSCFSVKAKDTIVSMDKNEEEIFYQIEKSYNREGSFDGFVTYGEIQNQEESQFALVKYSKKGKQQWIYSSPKGKEDNVGDLILSQFQEQVDGYLLFIRRINGTLITKIDLEGNYLWEIEIPEVLLDVKETHFEQMENGYIAVGYLGENGVLLHFDKDWNVEWKKEYPNSRITEVEETMENGIPTGYAIIKESSTEEIPIELIQTDFMGNDMTVMNSSLETLDSYHLGKANSGCIIYGTTSEVKVKKGDKSYYIIHYTSEGVEDWETIGDVPVNENKKLLFQEKNEKYYLFYINNSDQTAEVIRLNLDGLYEKKIKKIQSDYYDFENILIQKDIIYLVGQINCPEDDECAYDKNSLFLISDEDVVIEVEEKDSKGVLIIAGVITLLGIGFFFWKRKCQTKKK